MMSAAVKKSRQRAAVGPGDWGLSYYSLCAIVAAAVFRAA
jgi:hypothetical protein